MNDDKWELEKKQKRLQVLLDTRTKANCDTRHLSATDMAREEEIEDLEAAIAALEQKLKTAE